MECAARFNLQPVKLDARTSFETAPQYCSDRKVVGYAAIIYVQDASTIAHLPGTHDKSDAAAAEEFTEDTKRYLLRLARRSLDASVRNLPIEPPQQIPPEIAVHRGCFVTLTCGSALRGCIGYIEPVKPLYQAVIENAGNAALNDPRFSPVKPHELDNITIEISVLTKPGPLPYTDANDLLRKLTPHRDGVILSKGSHRSTYLPQVWEQLPDKKEFLEQLSVKGGMARDGWKTAEVKTYQAQHFSE
jgi:AmmeMemoRadiSam system protein A